MPTEPRAPKRDHEITAHGDTWQDPWFWIRDKDDPETIPYLEAENAYTKAVMADTEDSQEALYQEMRARIKEDDSSVPMKEGEFYYYRRYEAGGQYPIYCRRQGDLDGDETVILDVNTLAEGRDFLRIGVCQNSPDHKWLVYSEDVDGSEEYTIKIKDLMTGELLPGSIPKTYYALAWANDSQAFFYTLQNEFHRPTKVLRHRIGTDPSKDVVVYEEKDERFFVSVNRSLSGRMIYISAGGNNMDEWWFIDADDPREEPKLIEGRRENFEYDVVDHGDRFLIRNNGDGAKDFRISEVAIDSPSYDEWTDFISHEPGRLISRVMAFKNHVVVGERQKGLPEIRVLDLKGDSSYHIPFDEEAYMVWPVSGREWDTTTLRFSYMSMTTPETVYDYDMVSGDRVLRKKTEVPGGFDETDYETKRIWATARDGVQVPISMVYKKGTPLDGSAPLLLYGYGSYGACMEAFFQRENFSLVDRGIICATAHIRGGMEMGWDWYENGKLLKKKNTFTDYIDCAECLVREGYTKSDRLIARGGSAGGLLVGAVTNMRPDLFAGVVALVPFVDIVSTMLDDTLPLTTMEYNEWGNPNEPEFYEYIKSYSPYDNVIATDYPHMLITGGLNDPRVTYWEPTKWIAKLREMRTNDNMLIMDMKMGAGHAGASGRFEHLKETALEWAFVFKIIDGLGDEK